MIKQDPPIVLVLAYLGAKRNELGMHVLPPPLSVHGSNMKHINLF